jgi:superfamily II DNA or RNA helicase
MILRPYQNRTVTKATAALKKHGNTLTIASTGAGKTIILAALAGVVKGKTLILQHRQELVQQNSKKFLQVNPTWPISFFTADMKSFGGQATFAMVQTLCRNLENLPKFDHIIVDECHHLAARTYGDTIEACRERNPKLLLSGFTATPERGDKKSLRKYFDNVAEKITIRELVSLGFLVPPKAFVVNVGAQDDLARLGNQSAFNDQTDVAKILDTPNINAEVVRHWKERCPDRKTIIFCATCQHAYDVAEAFKKAGVESGVITGDMADGDRKATLIRFDKGRLQVLVNVAVLTEGYDSQPVSCVILLRQCSEKGPMIQMAGRGLRVIDPALYPGVTKKDCIILDFGTSLMTHGNLDQEDGLHEDHVPDPNAAPSFKTCPVDYKPGMVYRFPDRSGAEGCGAEVPAQTKTCPICGFRFERMDGEEEAGPVAIDMTEIDILNNSPFLWVDLFGTDTCLMASGFAAWAGVFSPDGGETWTALGKLQDEKRVHQLAITGKLQALGAADDFLRNYETDGSSKKTKRWLDDPATEKQLEILRKFGYDAQAGFMGRSPYTKYTAAAHCNFNFNKRLIESALGVN